MSSVGYYCDVGVGDAQERGIELDRLPKVLCFRPKQPSSSAQHPLASISTVSSSRFKLTCSLLFRLIRLTARAQLYLICARCRLAPALESPALQHCPCTCHHCNAFLSHDTIGSTKRRWLATKVPIHALAPTSYFSPLMPSFCNLQLSTPSPRPRS